MDSQNYTQVKNAIEELYLLTKKNEEIKYELQLLREVAKNHTDLKKKIEFVSSLFLKPGESNMNIHLKAMIGMKICNHIEELSPNRNSNPNTKKLIIPVGIPGSGKSSLVKLYQDEHTLILDADYMRERIFNFVFNYFFKTDLPFNTSQSGYTKNKAIQDIYPSKIIDPLKHLVNFGIYKDENIEEVKSFFHDEKTNNYCQGGTEGYCPSRVFFVGYLKDNEKKAKAELFFLPTAFDICLLYCKEFNKNFIYDGPNCEPHFRNNLMIRANRIGDFKETVISVLLPDLLKIDEQIRDRNESGIRQTRLPIKNFNEYFKIADTQATELQIHEGIKEKLHNKVTPEEIYNYYKDKYKLLSYDLYKLFNYLYESLGASEAYGSPKKNEYDITDFNTFEGKIKLEFKRFSEEIDREGNKILKDYVPPHTPPVSGEHTKSHDVYGKKFREETKFGPFDNAGGKKTKKRKSNKIKTKRKKGKRKIIRPLKTKRKRYTKRR